MKLSLLAVLLFLLPACATQPPTPPARPTANNANPTPNSLRTDAIDCERQAALAGAGGKSAAFESCMRARGRTPGQ